MSVRFSEIAAGMTHSRRIVIQPSVGTPMRKHDLQPEWADIFVEVQAAMTTWRREHPKATMVAIELETQRVLASLQARIVTDIAQHSEAAFFTNRPPAERPHCPDCGVPLQGRGAKERQLRGHGNQELRLAREHATCPQCERAFFPSG